MLDDNFILGDGPTQTKVPDAVSVIKEQDTIAKNSVKEIQESVTITEADKKKAESSISSASLSEEDEILKLAADLSSFIEEKIDIVNDNSVIERFPTGIDLLDAIAGGGFGIGTFTMLVGNPGTFKSSLLGQCIAAGQKKYKGKMLATYHDSENGMTTERLSQMGVNLPKLTPYDSVTVESIFKTVEAISAFKELHKIQDRPSIIAWDSIANTDTEKGVESEDTDINKTIGLKARLLSQLFPRFLPKMRKNNISIIAVNQLREKLDMGMFSAPNDLQKLGNKDIPGGQAVKFNAFHLLFLRNRGDLKYEQYGFNGIQVQASFVKNKFFRPHVPITLMVDFNKGVSNFWTNYNFLVEQKKITGMAWKTMLGYDEKKFRIRDAIDLYNDDVKYKKVFDDHLKTTIQTVIIDPNSGGNS